MSKSGVRRPAAKIASALVFALVLFWGGWWAGKVALAPEGVQEPLANTEPLFANVVQSEVGRSLQLSVAVRQPFVDVSVNMLSGVVTQTFSRGEASVGDVVYTVAGVPVRVVEGAEPFYRDLKLGDSGSDVVQLQEALTVLGYLSASPDGEFGSATRAAVRQWQEDLGVSPTGAVLLGELVAIDALPQALRLGDAIRIGQVLAGGEQAVQARTGTMIFELVLTQDQAQLVPSGARILIPVNEETTWEAIVAGQERDGQGQTVLALTAPDGGPVCQDDCDLLPPEETISILSTVEVVPAVEGPTVPVAAIHTSSSGDQYVVVGDGTEVNVHILGSAGGVAVVEGVEVGDVIRIDRGQQGESTDSGHSSNGLSTGQEQ